VYWSNKKREETSRFKDGSKLNKLGVKQSSIRPSPIRDTGYVSRYTRKFVTEACRAVSYQILFSLEVSY
jgi:hypothetical protein